MGKIDNIWCRDVDGTGSMHPCSKGDPGAIEFTPAIAAFTRKGGVMTLIDHDPSEQARRCMRCKKQRYHPTLKSQLVGNRINASIRKNYPFRPVNFPRIPMEQPQMTPTPDPTLAARLAALRSLADDSEAAQTAYACELSAAYRSGQLITLAERDAAVQAAVAKAVEAECAEQRRRADSMARSERETEREACAVIASKGSYSSADPYSIGCGQRIAAAIRARKGDTL